MKRLLLSFALAAAASYGVAAQVSSGRLTGAAQDAKNWLIYSGNYASTRHSQLAQITPANVKNLELKWMYQGAAVGAWQTTPLVVDGIMY
jgi:glucose dehydrogenase